MKTFALILSLALLAVPALAPDEQVRPVRFLQRAVELDRLRPADPAVVLAVGEADQADLPVRMPAKIPGVVVVFRKWSGVI